MRFVCPTPPRERPNLKVGWRDDLRLGISYKYKLEARGHRKEQGIPQAKKRTKVYSPPIGFIKTISEAELVHVKK